MTSSQTQSDDQALWQAFLYVQGELSVDDAEAFEQQMLDDADLCETVAEVSLLSSAVVACEQDIAVVRNSPADWSTGLRSLAVIVTGCCCAALLMFVADRPMKSSMMNANTTGDTEASVLLAAWIDNADSGEGEVEEDDLEADSAIDSELTVPDWILAGISEIEMRSATDSTTPQPKNGNPEFL